MENTLQHFRTAHEKTSANAGRTKKYEPTNVRWGRRLPSSESYEKQGCPTRREFAPFVEL
jgi:hypothetical protein